MCFCFSFVYSFSPLWCFPICVLKKFKILIMEFYMPCMLNKCLSVSVYFFVPGGFHGHCNFEFDLCSWRQLKSDSSNWLIKAGRTGAGPSSDHTLRNSSGHYLYVENSFSKTSGDTARLSSPVFSQSSRKCKVRYQG